MTKKELLKVILGTAVAFVPGGPAVKGGIEALINRNTDPDDDVDEVAEAVADIVAGTMLAVEGLSEKDFVDDPVLAQLLDNIKGDIRLYAQLVQRLKPIPPVPA